MENKIAALISITVMIPIIIISILNSKQKIAENDFYSETKSEINLNTEQSKEEYKIALFEEAVEKYKKAKDLNNMFTLFYLGLAILVILSLTFFVRTEVGRTGRGFTLKNALTAILCISIPISTFIASKSLKEEDIRIKKEIRLELKDNILRLRSKDSF